MRFEAKYQPGNYTPKEIDELGLSMNQMSTALEGTIAQLKSANLQLESDIQKKQQIDEMRKEFIANVSHELKTPITSIKDLADSLNMQPDAPVELYREFMQDITKEIDRESKIIEDLLSIVRLDKSAGNLNISSVNINELIEVVLKRLKPLGEKNMNNK